MVSLRLKQSLCGWSLQRGTVIIGYVQAVLAAVMLTLVILALVLPSQLKDVDKPAKTLVTTSSPNKDDDIELPTYDVYSVRNAISMIIYLVLQMIFCIFLILGAMKQQTKFLLPWLVFSGVGLVYQCVLYMDRFLTDLQHNYWDVALVSLLIFCILTALPLYFFLIVYSYYKELKDANMVANYAGTNTDYKI